MSRDLNKVIVIGRLGKEPEFKSLPSGSTVCNFTVASGRKWRTEAGEDREETEWFNVVAWNKLAQTCGDYLHKGSRVYIEGRLQTRSWDNKETGQKQYMAELMANDMIMLDAKPVESTEPRSDAGRTERFVPQKARVITPSPAEDDDSIPW